MNDVLDIAGEFDHVYDVKQVTWTIPAFSSLPTGLGKSCVSKSFYFSNQEMHFMIIPSIHRSGREYVCLFLCRQPSDETKSSIEYEMNFEWADGSVGTIEEKYRFTSEVFGNGVGRAQYFLRSELLLRLAPSDTLTLVAVLRQGCLLGMEPPPPNDRILIDLEKLSEDFKGLLSDKDSSDATLVVKGKVFRVHKSVLTARSPVFAAMFRHDMAEKETGTVDIPDCDEGTFGTFLEYLYSGRAEDLASFSSALKLYCTAEKYGVVRLKSFCAEYLARSLTVEGLTDALALSDQYNDAELGFAVQDFFNRCYGQIVVSEEWKSLIKQDFRLANKLIQGSSSYVSTLLQQALTIKSQPSL